ncbi:MucR family transcriptional regulator [Hyphococcus sp. DH-69]|uniref:MucR family transcriptional regulator n=1 Tax=Hyphococcus formosus TaxID=3143534 RepID=UPI00398B923A
MISKKPASGDQFNAISVAGNIVAAYVGNNSVKAEELPGLLHEVFSAVSGLAEEGTDFITNREPAVPVDKSVTPDFVICLEDGKKLKMLKRYLRTHYDLSPEEYRRKWGLPADYPMVAPNYAKRRSQFAKDIGLGTAATSKNRSGAKAAGKKTTAKKRVSKKK